MSKDIIETLIQCTLVGSGIGLLIMLVRSRLEKYLNLKIRYYLWLVVLLFLLIPIQLPNFISNQNQVVQPLTQMYQRQVYKPLRQTLDEVVYEIDPATEPEFKENTIEGSKSIYTKDILFIVWLIVSVGIGLFQMNSYFKYQRSLKSTRIDCDEEINWLFENIKNELNIKSPIKIYSSNEVYGAILIGVIQPTIYISNKEIDMESLNYILRHELFHQKNHDLIYKWLIMFVSWIHFFNPLVYFIQKKINNDCELVCDYEVVCNLSEDDRIEYGNTLLDNLRVGNTKINALTTSMSSSKKEVKERIIKISESKNRKKMIIATALMCASILLGCLLWPSVIKKPNVSAQVDEKVSIEEMLNSSTYHELMDAWGYTDELFIQLVYDPNEAIAILPTTGFFLNYESYVYNEDKSILTINYDSTSFVDFAPHPFIEQMLENNAFILFANISECNEIVMAGIGEKFRFLRNEFKASLRNNMNIYSIYETCAQNLKLRSNLNYTSSSFIGNQIDDRNFSFISKYLKYEIYQQKENDSLLVYTDKSNKVVASKEIVQGKNNFIMPFYADLNTRQDIETRLGKADYLVTNKDKRAMLYTIYGEEELYLYFILTQDNIDFGGFISDVNLINTVTKNDITIPLSSKICCAELCVGGNCGSLDSTYYTDFASDIDLIPAKLENEKELFHINLLYEYNNLSYKFSDFEVVKKVKFYENDLIEIDKEIFQITNMESALQKNWQLAKVFDQQPANLSDFLSDDATLHQITTIMEEKIGYQITLKNPNTASEILEELKNVPYLEHGLPQTFEDGFHTRFVIEDNAHRVIINNNGSSLQVVVDGKAITSYDAQVLAPQLFNLASSLYETGYGGNISTQKDVSMNAQIEIFENDDIKIESLVDQILINEFFQNELSKEELDNHDFSRSEIKYFYNDKEIKSFPYKKGATYEIKVVSDFYQVVITYKFIYTCK